MHKHHKHWLFHATMWVCAACILLAFGFVAWKFMLENKMLHDTVVGVKNKNETLQRDVIYCQSRNEELVGSNEVQPSTSDQCEVVPSLTCNDESCLFRSSKNDMLYGFGKLKGYFIKHQRDSLPPMGTEKSDKKVECSAFVVVGGTDELVADLKKSSWTYKNEKGNLIVTINSNQLSSSEKKKLNSSTEKQPVEVSVIRHIGEGRERLDCDTDIDLLNLK